MSLTPAWKLEADLDGDSASVYETDWSAYLMQAHVENGREHSLASIQPGRATFTLNNEDGRFSAANGIYDIDVFKRVRFYASTHYLFRGFITNISYEPEVGAQRCIIEATDILGIGGGIPINVDTINGFTSDMSLHRVLDLMEFGEAVTNPGIEVDTTGYALVNGATIARVTTAGNYFEGLAAIQCDTPGTNTKEGLSYDVTALTVPGGWYKVSMFCKIPVGSTFKCVAWDDVYGEYTTMACDITETGAWQAWNSGDSTTGWPIFFLDNDSTVRQVRILTFTSAQEKTFYIDDLHVIPFLNKILRALEAGATSLTRVGFRGASALEAVRQIVDSEPGYVWVDGSGTLQFKNNTFCTTLRSNIIKSADDGFLLKLGANYAAARAAAATVETTGHNYVGQHLGGGIYSIYRLYLRFDCTSIAAGQTVLKATLRLPLGCDDTDTDFTIQARQFAWGTLAAGDWRASPSGDPLMGSVTTGGTSWPTSAGNWVEIDIDVATITKEGWTELYLHSNRNNDDDDDPASTEPTGDEWCYFHSFDTNLPAQLIVDYGTVEQTFSDAGDQKDYQGLRVQSRADDRISLVNVNCAPETWDQTSEVAAVIWRYGGPLTMPADTYKYVYVLCSGDWHGPVTLTCLPAQGTGYASIFPNIGGGCDFRLYVHGDGFEWIITDLHLEAFRTETLQGDKESIYIYEPPGASQWVQRTLDLDMPFDLPTSAIVIAEAMAKGDKYATNVFRADLTVLPDTNTYLYELMDLSVSDRVRLINTTTAYSLGIDKNCWVEGYVWDIQSKGSASVTFHLEEV